MPEMVDYHETAIKEAVKEVGTKPKVKPRAARKNSTTSAPKSAPKPAARKRKAGGPEEEGEAKKSKVGEEEGQLEHAPGVVMEKEEEKDGFVFSESMLDEFFLKPDGFSTSTQAISDTVILEEENEESETVEDDDDAEGNETMIEVDNVKERELVLKLESLTKNVEEKDIEIAEIKSKMEEKEKTWNENEMIKQGTINSLEEENGVLSSRLQRYTGSVPSLMQELHKLRESAKANDKTNNKTELAKVKKNLKEAGEKLEAISLEKTFFEAEAKRNSRIVDNLSTLLQLEREGAEAPRGVAAAHTPTTPAPAAPVKAAQEKETKYPNKKCFKFERGMCKVVSCPFFHPTQVCETFSKSGVCKVRDCLRLHLGDHKVDCFFWKQGSCKFDEHECGKGLHRPEMFDINQASKAEVTVRKSQTGSGAPTPSAWAPAPTINQPSFFEEGRANPVADLLRSMLTATTTPSMMTPATAPNMTRTTTPEQQAALLLQLLAPMAPALLALQGGRPDSH